MHPVRGEPKIFIFHPSPRDPAHDDHDPDDGLMPDDQDLILYDNSSPIPKIETSGGSIEGPLESNRINTINHYLESKPEEADEFEDEQIAMFGVTDYNQAKRGFIARHKR